METALSLDEQEKMAVLSGKPYVGMLLTKDEARRWYIVETFTDGDTAERWWEAQTEPRCRVYRVKKNIAYIFCAK